jgi:DNA-binding response OmpR family regulator
LSGILVIDDGGALDLYRTMLRTIDVDPVTTDSGEYGLALARQCSFDLIVAELRTSGMSGLIVLQELRRANITTPFMIITGFGDVRSAVRAMRLGADEYLLKPILLAEFIGTVKALLARSLNHRLTCPVQEWGDSPHAAARWASLVVRAVESPSDLATLNEWARRVSASRGALKNWCSAAHLSAGRSLLFVRLLRAVARHANGGFSIENSLNVVDKRTFRKFIVAAGALPHAPETLPLTISQFLRAQRLIEDVEALTEVRRRLTLMGIDIGSSDPPEPSTPIEATP